MELFTLKQKLAVLKAISYLGHAFDAPTLEAFKELALKNPKYKHVSDGSDTVSAVFLLAYRRDEASRAEERELNNRKAIKLIIDLIQEYSN